MCLNVFVWFLFSLKVEKLNLQALGTSRTNPMSPKYKGIGDIICKFLRNEFYFDMALWLYWFVLYNTRRQFDISLLNLRS